MLAYTSDAYSGGAAGISDVQPPVVSASTVLNAPATASGTGPNANISTVQSAKNAAMASAINAGLTPAQTSVAVQAAGAKASASLVAGKTTAQAKQEAQAVAQNVISNNGKIFGLPKKAVVGVGVILLAVAGYMIYKKAKK